MRRTSSIVSWVSAALMPAVGSSRHNSCGSVASAMPISRLRCSPCERLAARSSALAEQADGLQHGLRLADDVVEVAMVLQHAPAVPPRLRGNAHILERGGVGRMLVIW